jgi:hypothetical protein
LANVQHNALTDPNIHEPKGITSAVNGEVYMANGSGSGTWKLPSGHAYGELYITAGTTAQTLAAASGTAILNPTDEWTSGYNNHITQTPASGTLTVTEAGLYDVNFYTIFTTASLSSGTQYNFYYAVNGTISTRKLFARKTSNGVDTLHVNGVGLVELAENDVLSMHVGGDATSSSTNIVVLEAGLITTLINPT